MAHALNAGWESGHLVPVTLDDEASYGYLPDIPEEHPLTVALRAYALVMRRAARHRHVTLPASFGLLRMTDGHPYVAFSAAEWHRACADTCKHGHVSLSRMRTLHRAGKHRGVPTSQGIRFSRAAPVTHWTIQVAAALPRVPRDGRYFRVWMLRTPPLRVEDDRLRGGTLLCAAYDDLWADLGRRVEALIPTALADWLTHGTPV